MCFPEGSLPDIGRVLQNAPHCASGPIWLAFRTRFAGLLQAVADGAETHAFATNPGKDLLDHAGLFWNQLIAGLPTSFDDTHILITIRSAGQHARRAHLRCMPFAAPAPLQDFGALV